MITNKQKADIYLAWLNGDAIERCSWTRPVTKLVWARCRITKGIFDWEHYEYRVSEYPKKFKVAIFRAPGGLIYPLMTQPENSQWKRISSWIEVVVEKPLIKRGDVIT